MKQNTKTISHSILQQPVNRRTILRTMAFGAAGLSVGLTSACKPVEEKKAPLPEPLVKTQYGPVRGYINKGVYTFRGVRYGATTGGENRFKPPKAPSPWTEIRDASSYGYRAPQTNPAAPFSMSPDTEIGKILLASDGFRVPSPESEDCLFLNIWTPAIDQKEKRPVMVWLHGGGFSMGSSSDLLYDGTNLARRGAVMVGVNHRLNVFGYTHLGDIAGEEYAHSGNAGQLDIIFALKWVKENIEKFGGDPDRVMIFGESGGGAKVCMLLTSPSSKGLFHSAVIESGPGIKVEEREAATKAAGVLLSELAITRENIAEIHKFPTDKILVAYFAATAKLAGQGGFGPVIDPVILPDHPFYPKAPMVSANVPIMVGWNKTESTAFSLGQDELWALDEEGLKKRVEIIAGTETEKLIKLYRKIYPDMSPSSIYFHIASYSGMGSGSVTIAERKMALGKAPAYLYRFDWETPVLGGKLISPHGLEMPFVFDNVNEGGIGLSGGGAAAQKMADKLSEAWIAFAATGDPNTQKSGLPLWDPYDSQKRPTMIFDKESRVEFDPLKEQRIIFERIKEKKG
jgi:para-nitrobenzyl esterase